MEFHVHVYNSYNLSLDILITAKGYQFLFFSFQLCHTGYSCRGTPAGPVGARHIQGAKA